MAEFRQQIGSVTVRGALDGRRPSRGPLQSKSADLISEVVANWCCPQCGLQTSDPVEHAKHMTSEYYELRQQINQIRDLIGDERRSLRSLVTTISPGSKPGQPDLDGLMTTFEVAQVAGITRRHARRVVRSLGGSRFVGGALVVDERSVAKWLESRSA